MHRWSACCLMLSAGGSLLGQQPPLSAHEPADEPADETVTFTIKTVEVAGRDHRYAVYVPPSKEGYTPRWPVLVFLHDKSGSGADAQEPMEVGLGPAIRKDPARWPFVAVFPQKPDADSEWIEHDALVMAVLAAVEEEYRTDTWRRLLTGVGQGGAGAWAIAAKHAKVWAAIAPVGGRGEAAEIAAITHSSSVWEFDGVREAYLESNLAEWLRVQPVAGAIDTALREPDQVVLGGFDLTIEMGTQMRHGTGRNVEHLSLTSYGTSSEFWKGGPQRWRVVVRHWHETGSGTEFQRVTVDEASHVGISAPDAEACLKECVRLMVRAGVCDFGMRDDISYGDYVEVDHSCGTGGRSVSLWPRSWKVGAEHGEEIAAARKAAGLVRQLHSEAEREAQKFPWLHAYAGFAVLLVAAFVFRRCQLPRRSS